MTEASQRKTLSTFCWLTAAGILVLIFLGAMVTTKDAGLAVPDWPLSFGSLNPEGWWLIESVRLEHGHRLVGALVGLLILISTFWTFKLFPDRLPRILAVAALLGVIAQGVMGGLRVTEVSLTLAIIHGVFGQVVLCSVVFLALVASPPEPLPYREARQESRFDLLKVGSIILCTVIFGQLIVAAIMRHLKHGLAIPDFPLSNGQWIPAFETFGVGINFTHRLLALVILILVAWMVFVVVKRAKDVPRVLHAAAVVAFLVLVQITLGALTVWSIRAPVPTTFHVMNGALLLGAGVVLLYRAHSGGFVSAHDEVPEHDADPAQSLPQTAAT